MLYWDNSGNLVTGSPIVWADWAMHISQTNSFYERGIVESIKNSHIYAGTQINYPFMVNLLSAGLMTLGFSLRAAFVLPSIIFSILFVISLYLFGKVLFKSIAIAILGTHLFLTGGGLGFIYIIKDFISKPSMEVIFNSNTEYTRMTEKGIYWYSTLIASHIPQRAFLMGMPIALIILTILINKYKLGFANTSKLRIFILGLATGLLMWIHPHSLIAVGLVCALLLFGKPKLITFWLIYLFGTVSTAAPFLLLNNTDSLSGFFKFYPGWLTHSPEINISWLGFWILNWGFVLPLLLIILLRFRHSQNKESTLLALAGILLFALCNLFIFQPSDWDNTKLLIWVYCIFSFVISSFLMFIWKKSIPLKILAVSIFVALTASGSLDLFYLLNFKKHTHVMIDYKNVALAQEFKSMSNPHENVLSSDYHLHWVPVLTGRPIVMGYRGWLWSYGINYGKREEDIKKIYQGNDNAMDLLNIYKISYVIVGPEEKNAYLINQTFFRNNFPILLEKEETSIFDTRAVMFDK